MPPHGKGKDVVPLIVAAPPPPSDLDDGVECEEGDEVLGKREREATSAGVRGETDGEEGRSGKRAALFPTDRIHEALKQGGYAPQVRDGAAVYLSAVLEQITARLLDKASKEDGDDEETRADARERRIVPRAIQMALAKDEDMQRTLAHLQKEVGCEWAIAQTLSVDSGDATLRDTTTALLSLPTFQAQESLLSQAINVRWAFSDWKTLSAGLMARGCLG